jgi:hypothetical protein
VKEWFYKTVFISQALEKEVGENVDIKPILAGHSNWKGRQQQIRMLQSKVNPFLYKFS